MAITVEDLNKWWASQKPQQSVLGSGISAIGTLLNGNAAYDNAGSNVSSLQEQEDALARQQASMPSLASMYGADSPYAQQLAQELARKDAAAGRNSQYGPRSVELQARLADKASQYGAQQAQSAQAYQQARLATQNARTNQQNQQQQIRAQQLASLFDVADKSGLMKPINQGLNSLFSKAQGYFGMGGDSGMPSYDYGISNLPNSGSSPGFSTSYSDQGNPYSLQTGNAPGMSSQDPNALMPQWNAGSSQNYAPSNTGGDPWAFLDNQ